MKEFVKESYSWSIWYSWDKRESINSSRVYLDIYLDYSMEVTSMEKLFVIHTRTFWIMIFYSMTSPSVWNWVTITERSVINKFVVLVSCATSWMLRKVKDVAQDRKWHARWIYKILCIFVIFCRFWSHFMDCGHNFVKYIKK